MPLTAELIRAITPISEPAHAPRISETRQPHQPLPQPGQQVLAEVVAKLSDNVVVLKIAGELFRADIALPLRQGQVLQLTYKGSEPRPAFSLESSAPAETPVTISKTAAAASETAKSVFSNPSPMVARPLLPSGGAHPGITAALATALKNALTNSGIFYESHLVHWFLGARNIAELKKEPQARLAVRDRGESLPPGPNNRNPDPEQHGDMITAADSEITTNRGLLETILASRDPEIAALVREQIQTATTGIFRWQGEAWPGQEMAWEVEQQEQDSGQTPENPWQTTIRLQTPLLGSIEATLVTSGKNVTCTLHASAFETCQLVRREQGELENRMAEAGLTLKTMVITGETTQ